MIKAEEHDPDKMDKTDGYVDSSAHGDDIIDSISH